MSELVTASKTAKHLQVINAVEAGLAEMEKEHETVIDLATDEGFATGKERLKHLVRARNSVEDARLAHNRALRDIVKADIEACDKLANEAIQPRIAKLEGPLSESIKAIEDEHKRIKAEAAAAEQARIDGIQERIADIKSAASNAITLDDVNSAIERYGNVTLESFEEFAEEAELAIADMDTALIEKRKALEAQAAEATRLAEQKAEQERIAAEQKEAADKLAAEQAEMEQWKAEKAEREAQEKREADEKEAERVEMHKRNIESISTVVDYCSSADACDKELKSIGDIDVADFEEFADEAAHAIANAKLAITEKRRQLIAEDEEAEYDEALAENARRDQAAADLKAAEEAGAKREREKKAKEAADRKAAKAEAARLKKLEPAIDQLRSYIVELNEVQTPEFDEPELVEALATITDQLQDMTEIPDSLGKTAAA